MYFNFRIICIYIFHNNLSMNEELAIWLKTTDDTIKKTIKANG